MINIKIPLYVVNLKSRKDRLTHIREEFKGREEFDVNIVEAEISEIGAVGLWKSILKIVALAEKREEDVIVVCEDDHIFTASYSAEYFIETIFLAHRLETKLLVGGISGGNTLSVFVNENLLWVDRFWGTQFIVIYKGLFKEILKFDFKKTDVADEVLSSLTSNKLVMYPMISMQKEIGQSDISSINSKKGHVERLFSNTNKQLDLLYQRYSIYNKI